MTADMTGAGMHRRPRRTQADEATIGRLRQLSDQSTGPRPQEEHVGSPDWQLLGLCAEALNLMAASGRLDEERRGMVPFNCALYQESKALVREAKPIMNRISKMPATTAAGIYAKALIVRGSRTGAQCLAMSLAKDLTANQTLRSSLWPAAHS